LLNEVLSGDVVVGAICAANVFLGMNGCLNEKSLTSNMFDALIEWVGSIGKQQGEDQKSNDNRQMEKHNA